MHDKKFITPFASIIQYDYGEENEIQIYTHSLNKLYDADLLSISRVRRNSSFLPVFYVYKPVSCPNVQGVR